MPDKRVLVLSYEYPPLGGGGAKVVAGLVERFAQRGYALDVITMGYKGLPKFEAHSGVRVYRVSYLRRNVSMCRPIEMIPYMMCAFFLALKLMKRNSYHLIHSHFIFPDGIITALLKKWTRIPGLVTAHGSDVPGYNPNRFILLHEILMPFWRKVVRALTLIICPSKSLRNLIHRSEHKAKVYVIPNGFSPNKFRHDRQKTKSILIVSRLFERKGVQYVLQALKNITHDYSVHIVGDGPYLQPLKQISQELRVKVTFHGYMDNNSEEFKELFETSRIFVFPSEVENFPIVLLEAMGAGMAIITTKGTGCAEVVGEDAMLVIPRDVAAIESCINTLINDNKRCQELGMRARRRLEDHFCWQAVVNRYEHVYNLYSL
jgi:glycosyltransferase involved in cell wall biosynthesis